MAKTVIIHLNDVDERRVYATVVKCPYCNHKNCLEWEFLRPESCECFRCEKEITFTFTNTTEKCQKKQKK